MSDVVWVRGPARVKWQNGFVFLRVTDPPRAVDDPVVRAYPERFTTRVEPAPEPADVERATRAPGERRYAPRRGRR